MSREPTPPPTLDPDRLANKSFGSSFRGYDQDEVRVYLLALSEQLREMRAYQADLQRRLDSTQARLLDQPDLDEAQLTRLLGEETARVLSAAREAASDIRARAEENVARLVREAGERAQETRAAADEYVSKVRGEAERGLQERWDEVEAHGIEIRAKADAYADEVRSGIDMTVERITSEAETRAAEIRAEAEADGERVQTEAAEYVERVRLEADDYLAQARVEADSYATPIRVEADSYAAEVRAEADGYSQQVRAGAEEAASEMTAEASRLLDARTAEAEAAVAELQATVRADTDRLKAEAESILTSAQTEAEAERQAKQREGKEMVAEAVRVRERMLKDLARRRKIARQQLEQLRAARERLLESYEIVRRTVDEVTQELMVALPEAKVAAEDAGRRVAREPETTVEQLESEITMARQAGLPLVAVGDYDEVDHVNEGSVTATDSGETEAVAAHLGLSVPEAVSTHAPVAELARSRQGERVLEVRSSVEPAEEVVAGAADADVRDQPSPATTSEDPAAAGGEADPPARDVDALFAKLRASRKQKAAGARAVLTEERPPRPGANPDDAGQSSDRPLPGTPVRIDVPTAASAANANTAVDSATATLLERRDAATEKVEQVLSRKLKRVLADEQSQVLDAVRRSRKFPGLDDVFPSSEDHAQRFAKAVIDDLRQAAGAGAVFGGGAESTATSVDDVAEALGREFSSLIRPRVERCFEDLGGDEDELNDRIRAIYREWKTPRLAETSRHFVLLAFSRGLYDVVPEGTCLQWVIDDGGQPCPDAEDNFLAGAVERGQPFPTGHLYPPAHPGCRCLVVPAAQ